MSVVRATVRRAARRTPNEATEHEHQVNLFQWAALQTSVYPELALMYAIPNAAKRSVTGAAFMKAEGLRAGVPDVCLPIARQGYNALYIELKHPTKGRVSEAQQWWITQLAAAGNMVKIAWGWDEAREIVSWYVGQQSLPGFGNTG